MYSPRKIMHGTFSLIQLAHADLSPTSSEIIVYLTAILGMVGDQTSTRLGLMFLNVFESNPFVAFLMSRGLWLPFDLLMLTISIVLPLFLGRIVSFKGKSAILTFPLIFGVIRILATVSNFLLFFSARAHVSVTLC